MVRQDERSELGVTFQFDMIWLSIGPLLRWKRSIASVLQMVVQQEHVTVLQKDQSLSCRRPDLRRFPQSVHYGRSRVALIVVDTFHKDGIHIFAVELS